MICGIRGAIGVEANTAEAMVGAAMDLLSEIISKNQLKTDEISWIIITATPDLNAEFPAVAVRRLGYTNVPVICSVEIDVPGSEKMILRMLVQAEIECLRSDIEHVYLGRAASLRPDLI